MKRTESGPNISKNHQKDAYDKAYQNAEVIPFPDRKIEGSDFLKNKTIVSVGGGIGSDVAHLAKDNQVHILDYSASTAPIATALGLRHHQIDLGSPTFRLPFADGSVDILVLKDILEHLLEPSLLMDESRRVLARGGRLVISIPNHFNLWGRLRILFGGNLIWRGLLHDHGTAYSEWNYMHIRFFTWRGLKTFIAESNFRVVRTFFDFGPFGHYFSIPMYAEHLKIKEERGLLTPKGKLFLKVGFPIYRFIDFIFPTRLRNVICRISPSMLTSCFYLYAEPVASSDY